MPRIPRTPQDQRQPPPPPQLQAPPEAEEDSSKKTDGLEHLLAGMEARLTLKIKKTNRAVNNAVASLNWRGNHQAAQGPKI